MIHGGMIHLGDWSVRYRAASQALKDPITYVTEDLSTVIELSSGNQQKVLVAKRRAAPRNLIILDEPERGTDVASLGEIHEIRRRAREAKAGL
jgi:ABC-type uncharacterized transport system ATPase subunit